MAQGAFGVHGDGEDAVATPGRMPALRNNV
jgi:hypothetical protein